MAYNGGSFRISPNDHSPDPEPLPLTPVACYHGGGAVCPNRCDGYLPAESQGNVPNLRYVVSSENIRGQSWDVAMIDEPITWTDCPF